METDILDINANNILVLCFKVLIKLPKLLYKYKI